MKALRRAGRLRVLLASYAEPGHVVPLLGVARALMARDCDVFWTFPFLYPGQGLPAEMRGFGGEILPPFGIELPAWFEAEAAPLYPIRTGRDRSPLLALMTRASVQIRPAIICFMRRALKRARADVLAIDTISTIAWPGAIAAALERVPSVGLATNIGVLAPETSEIFGDLQTRQRGQTDRLLQRRSDCLQFGVAPELAEEPFDGGLVVFTTHEFVGEGASIPRAAHLVGPSRTSPLSAESQDSALRMAGPIVVSFGSQLAPSPELLAKVTTAAASLDVRLLINGGALAGSRFAAGLPGAVSVWPRIDQTRLLANARLLITHGGWNSVAEALDRGVPLLVSPVDCDQPVTAHFVRRSGVGEVLDLRTASVDACRATLTALLAPGSSYARRAREIQVDMHQHDGAAEAAAVISSAADAKPGARRAKTFAR